MDKYALLMILNIPFVALGLARAIVVYKKGRIKPLGLLGRLVFWMVVLCGLVFAEEIYYYLVAQGLTDSAPLSIADVVLVTGLNLCLFLILRLYAKLEGQERRMADLHEKLSIKLSKHK